MIGKTFYPGEYYLDLNRDKIDDLRFDNSYYAFVLTPTGEIVPPTRYCGVWPLSDNQVVVNTPYSAGIVIPQEINEDLWGGALVGVALS
jgi:hypothetical protein